MSTTLTLRATASALIKYVGSGNHYTPDAYQRIVFDTVLKTRLLFTFEQPAAAYKYKIYDRCRIYFYSKSAFDPSYRLYDFATLTPVSEPFDISTVTWNTQPALDTNYDSDLYEYEDVGTYMWREGSVWFKCINYGLAVDPGDTGGMYVATTQAASTYWPYIVITFTDEKAHLNPSGYPHSGYYRNPREDIELKWYNPASSSLTLETPTQTSATVQWRQTGTSQATSINVTTATSVIIPANTWSASTSYEWRVSVTDSGGTTTTTEWYNVSTTASEAQPPTLIYPDGEVVDGSAPITFRWANWGTWNDTGTDLAFSTDGSTWGEPVNLGDNVETYTAPAGTFTSGTNYWRARDYNADGVAGDWGTPKTFIVVAAPQAPYIEVINNPRPIITWESEEQQAFQVQMGDYDSGMIYGTEKTFRCPEYLPNGQREVRVRVMNEFNMWSEWAGTTITITNTPGTAPTLTVTAASDASLSWTSVSGASRYLIYRDGVKIGETTGLTYIDRWSNGAATYFVRADKENIPLTMEQGTISTGNGNNSDSTTKIRTNGYIAMSQPVRVTIASGFKYSMRFYSASSYLESKGYYREERIFPNDTWKRCRIVVGYENDSTITPSALPAGALTVEVLGWYADSNQVTVSVKTDHPMISGIDGGWIDLKYSTDPVHTVEVSSSQYVGLMQYSGSEYPTPEVAIQKERIYHIVVAFRNGESGPFEALIGKVCFLKDQFGNAIYGVISSITKAQNRFYTVCSADLIQIEGTP